MTIKERLEQNNNEIAACIKLVEQFSSAGVATGLSVGASETATKNEEATNGNVHLNLTDKNGVMDSHKIVGAGGTSVTSDENGTITIGLAAAGTSLGGVKSGGDVTINDGEITVNQATKAATCDLSTITTTLGNLYSQFIRTTTDINFINSGSTTVVHTIPAWSIGFYGCNNGADGAILTIDTTGHIKTAYRNNGTWQNSRTMLDNNNYNSYSPKLDGTGATGTWGINISGNAATASVLKCSDTGGLTTDQYGNLVPNSTTAQYWNIYKDKDKSAVGFKVTWASGNVETAGTITASGAIISNSGVIAQSAADQLMRINNNSTSAANAYLKV